MKDMLPHDQGESHRKALCHIHTSGRALCLEVVFYDLKRYHLNASEEM
jgi:hypothetical protein